MKTIEKSCVLFIAMLFLVTLSLVDSLRPVLAESPKLSKVVFYVQWYDVGKAALEGLEGIKWIEKGFHNLKEINTVYYEPSTITVEEMEDALKKAGTYGGTVK